MAIPWRRMSSGRPTPDNCNKLRRAEGAAAQRDFATCFDLPLFAANAIAHAVRALAVEDDLGGARASDDRQVGALGQSDGDRPPPPNSVRRCSPIVELRHLEEAEASCAGPLKSALDAKLPLARRLNERPG